LDGCVRSQVSFQMSQWATDADGAVYYTHAEVAFSRCNTCMESHEIGDS
jgi:hypothetical protein